MFKIEGKKKKSKPKKHQACPAIKGGEGSSRDESSKNFTTRQASHMCLMVQSNSDISDDSSFDDESDEIYEMMNLIK